MKLFLSKKYSKVKKNYVSINFIFLLKGILNVENTTYARFKISPKRYIYVQ